MPTAAGAPTAGGGGGPADMQGRFARATPERFTYRVWAVAQTRRARASQPDNIVCLSSGDRPFHRFASGTVSPGGAIR